MKLNDTTSKHEMIPADGPFYKGYYMITSRCNLDCDYCVLEDAPDQLRRELSLEGKMEMIAHLHHLGFRRLTLSGGEVLLIGRHAPNDFLRLLRFLRGLRSPDPRQDLEVDIYSNGSYLDDRVADALVGVVDQVAITIDSNNEKLLGQIGRNTGRFQDYFRRAVEVCRRLTERGIQVKLHSVVGTLNTDQIGSEVRSIYEAIRDGGGQIAKWKFYQYMSYDDPVKDGFHSISREEFQRVSEEITDALESTGVPLHFKNTAEMHESLFNIQPYGTAQYMVPGDTWSTSRLTGDLRTYDSMQELFRRHDIDQQLFRRYHELKR